MTYKDMPAASDTKEVIHELGTAYLFNLITIADQEDEGGFDHPLEKKHQCLQPFIDSLLEGGYITTEEYEEDGESGEEYIPSDKGGEFLEQIKNNSDLYLGLDDPDNDADRLRKAFYHAMQEGSIMPIDESKGKWYSQITSASFYRNLTNDLPQSENTEEAELGLEPYRAPAPRSYRGASEGESAFNITEDQTFEVPHQSYRYKKPALIHGIIAVVFALIAIFTKVYFIFLITALFIYFAVYYFQKRFTFHRESLHLVTLFGSKTINYVDIAETTLQEETNVDYDGDVDVNKSIEIIGQNGISMEASDWLEDFGGFRHLVDRCARSFN